jgi:ABC-type sugar transport system substrate-binding protein
MRNFSAERIEEGGMAGWLRTMAAAGLFLVLVPAAWSAELRVGFVNPTGPPEFWNLVDATMQAAAAELDIKLEVRHTERSKERALAAAQELVSLKPPLDFLIGTNDVEAGGDIIKIAEAAHVKLILLSNDLDRKDWPAYGEPRRKYGSWLGSITPDHEGGGYGIAEAVLTAAAKVKTNRPLKLLALNGDEQTPASLERLNGLKRAVGVMTKLLGPNSVELVGVRWLDWTTPTAEAATQEFMKDGPRIDALWAANDPMAIGGLQALRAAYTPGKDVLVGGLNWSQPAVDLMLKGEMVVSHGGHFLGGAWAMVVLRDYADGRDFAEEDVRLQFPMGAFDLPLAHRFPEIGKVDWRQVDFTRYSKTRHPELKRYDFSPESVLAQIPPSH